MRPRAGHAAFAAALLAFVAAVALIGLLFDGSGGGSTGAPATSTAPSRGASVGLQVPAAPHGMDRILRRRAVRSSLSEDLRRRSEVPRGIRSAEGAARWAFRRFALAYLRYEAGRADAAVRRVIEATASTGFAHELLASPPRVPPTLTRPPRADLDGELTVTPLGPLSRRYSPLGPARRVVVEALARRSGGVERLAFVLELMPGGWRVTQPAGG